MRSLFADAAAVVNFRISDNSGVIVLTGRLGHAPHCGSRLNSRVGSASSGTADPLIPNSQRSLRGEAHFSVVPESDCSGIQVGFAGKV
jgi:hypothetical protein